MMICCYVDGGMAPQRKNIKWRLYINNWQLIVWESNIRMWSASYPHMKKVCFFFMFKKMCLTSSCHFLYSEKKLRFIFIFNFFWRYELFLNFSCQKTQRNFFCPTFLHSIFLRVLRSIIFFWSKEKFENYYILTFKYN